MTLNTSEQHAYTQRIEDDDETIYFIYSIPGSRGKKNVLFTEEEKIPFIDSTLTPSQ